MFLSKGLLTWIMAMSLGHVVLAEVVAKGSCKMDVVELQRKRAALRRAVACDMMPHQCPAILGLGGMAAAGAGGYAANRMATKSANVGKKIRNPFAKMCSVTEYRFKKLSELIANRFVLTPALANTCEVDLKFLNSDLDRAVTEHTGQVKKLVTAQNAEIEKLNVAKAEKKAALAKALGANANTSSEQLMNLAESRANAPSAPSASPYASLTSAEKEKRRLINELDKAKADLASIKERGGDAKSIATRQQLVKFAEDDVKEAFGNDLDKYRSFRTRMENLARQPAASGGVDKATVSRLSKELGQITSQEATMKSNLGTLRGSLTNWIETGAGRFRGAMPKDLGAARGVLNRLTQEGAAGDAARMAESRLANAELRAGARAGFKSAAAVLGRQAIGKGVARLGVIAFTGPVGAGVAFASEALAPTQAGCGNVTAFYLSKTSNCGTDYEVTGKNADVLFSDELGKQLYFSNSAKEREDYMCFIKANWEKRFAQWKVTCKPGATDTGKFKNKVYAQRADGTHFEFNQSTDPKVIGASLTNTQHYSQALEIASCCNDTSPRISASECKSNYGINVASDGGGSGGSNNSGGGQRRSGTTN